MFLKRKINIFSLPFSNYDDEDEEFEKKKKNLPKNYLIKVGIVNI